MNTTTTYTVVNHIQKDMCLHKVGCRDIERGIRRGEVNQTYNITVTDGDDLVRAVDIDLAASGIASDYGQTPEEWADENSYGATIFPCCEEAK
mgnify:CR=1 FL=1